MPSPVLEPTSVGEMIGNIGARNRLYNSIYDSRLNVDEARTVYRPNLEVEQAYFAQNLLFYKLDIFKLSDEGNPTCHEGDLTDGYNFRYNGFFRRAVAALTDAELADPGDLMTLDAHLRGDINKFTILDSRDGLIMRGVYDFRGDDIGQVASPPSASP